MGQSAMGTKTGFIKKWWMWAALLVCVAIGSGLGRWLSFAASHTVDVLY
jgi:hypothetical protein